MKSFLLKMRVIGKSLDQTFSAHGFHRNTVRQAIAFVWPVRIELETGEERLVRLR